jgi:hypothetical protein
MSNQAKINAGTARLTFATAVSERFSYFEEALGSSLPATAQGRICSPARPYWDV